MGGCCICTLAILCGSWVLIIGRRGDKKALPLFGYVRTSFEFTHRHMANVTFPGINNGLRIPQKHCTGVMRLPRTKMS